ncbi:MAG: DUF3619 family protein [Aquabacterium sp.]|jgi:hypothetical protein|uniref:DUF3619 family protein n=1 Tax=Aquabacterium sp. TaxID=1872578 RepID=UPI003BAFD5DD
MSSTKHLTPAQTEALQACFALRVTARLDEGARQLPHDIGERLRIARQQAVAAAAQARLAPLVAPAAQAGVIAVTTPKISLAGAGSSGADAFGTPLFNAPRRAHTPHEHRRLDDGPTPWFWRLASTLPVIALVAGLWGVSDWTRHEQVQAAADVDMSLLTDDLPPSAYADPGFEEYLKTDADQPAQATESAALQEAEQALAEDLAPAVSSDAHTDVMPGVDNGVPALPPAPR